MLTRGTFNETISWSPPDGTGLLVEFTKLIELLLVEDNAGDVRLLQEAIRGSGVRVSLHIARNGLEAIRYLGREGDYEREPRPDLILLDIHLPVRDGVDVLSDISANPDWNTIPVVILTGDRVDPNITERFGHIVRTTAKKPVHPEELRRILDLVPR